MTTKTKPAVASGGLPGPHYSQADELLQAILAHCDRGNCPSNKWPDRKGDYWPLNPLRADSRSGSFSVGPKGWKDFATGEGGGLAALGARLGLNGCRVAVIPGGQAPPSPPLTLEEYARAKALPVAFLRGLGLDTVHLQGRTCVRIPYYDSGGVEVGARLRLAMTGHNRFRWRKGTKVQPYGLERLSEARQANYVILTEGESDAATLWYHGLPALGIPGASTWQPAWAAYLKGLVVYVWQEDDQGGRTFVTNVGAALPDVRIISAPLGRKDASECHVLGDDIPALLRQLMAEAQPYSSIAAQVASRGAETARAEAGDLLACPDILARLGALLPALGLVGEDVNAKLLYLALTSRLLDRPVNMVLKGPSAGGKSFVVGTILKFSPTNSYIDLTSMSEHLLVYDERPIAHKYIVLFEAAGLGADKPGEPNTLAYCMRSLLSEGCIKYGTVERTADGLRPKLIARTGPTGLITTTTLANLHTENETRLLSLTVKDDSAHTRRVLGALADRANGQGPDEPDLGPWQALQTWLELAGERRTTIPYARRLAELTSDRAVRLRRDFTQVLALIQAHAILHQQNRGRDSQGRIVANLADYSAVYDLVLPIVSEGVEATISPVIRETVEAVRELGLHGTRAVTVQEVARHLHLDKSAALRRVRVALNREYLVNSEDKRGRPARLVMGEPLPAEKPVLPSPIDLASGCTVIPGGDGEPPEGQSSKEGGEGGAYPLGITATVQPPDIGDAVWCLGARGDIANSRPLRIADIALYPDGRSYALFGNGTLTGWPLDRCQRVREVEHGHL